MAKIDASEIGSKSELEFAQLWVSLFPSVDLVTQVKPVPKRRFALDFAHLPSKTGIEINGGIWSKSGHSSGKGLLRDYEKNLLAATQGWQILAISPQQITRENLGHIAAIIEARTKLLAK